MINNGFARAAVRVVLYGALAVAASAQVKVGVVDLQKALQNTSEIKAAEADLKAKFGPRQEQLSQLEREITKLQQDAEANQGKYNDATMAELSGRVQLKQRQYQRNSQALQDDLNATRQEVLSRVGKQLQEVVKKVADEKGLDLVVELGNTLFAKPTLDISTEVTAAYDQLYPPKK